MRSRRRDSRRTPDGDLTRRTARPRGRNVAVPDAGLRPRRHRDAGRGLAARRGARRAAAEFVRGRRVRRRGRQDACARGSLAGKGKLLALDASETKLEELRRRARRAGASNVQALAVDLRDEVPVAKLDQRRLARPRDAPCTGLGAIRRNPEARWRLREETFPALSPPRPPSEFRRAAPRPHGRLVFATCSFLPSEGEVAVDFFLSEHPTSRSSPRGMSSGGRAPSVSLRATASTCARGASTARPMAATQGWTVSSLPSFVVRGGAPPSG